MGVARHGPDRKLQAPVRGAARQFGLKLRGRIDHDELQHQVPEARELLHVQERNPLSGQATGQIGQQTGLVGTGEREL
jgi:hypothetical protein